jgi:uncharacterized protein (DUF1330 family)
MPPTRRELLGATAVSAAAMALWPRGLRTALAKGGQPGAGIISSEPATTFAEHVAKINASPAFFNALAEQPDNGPIINLNLIRCRPRGKTKTYEAYATVAGREIDNVGGSAAHYGIGITDMDAAYQMSDKWDVVDLPVYPRRHSYLQLQKSKAYQLAIPDRVGGTYERLLYVLSDDKPFFTGTTSIAELHKTKKPIPIKDGQMWVYELLRFKKGGAEHFQRYAGGFQKLLEKIGGKVVLSVRAEMPIVCEKFWDHFVLVQYPSLRAFKDLIKSDDWQTVNAHRLKAVERSLGVANNAVKIPG